MSRDTIEQDEALYQADQQRIQRNIRLGYSPCQALHCDNWFDPDDPTTYKHCADCDVEYCLGCATYDEMVECPYCYEPICMDCWDAEKGCCNHSTCKELADKSLDGAARQLQIAVHNFFSEIKVAAKLAVSYIIKKR